MIRMPRPHIRLGITGGIPPRPAGTPSSQDVMNKLKERNPGNLWRQSLYPAFVAQHAGPLTGVTATFGYDPLLMGIAELGNIGELKNLQASAREDPYGMAHEVVSKIAGGETYSDEWHAAKIAAQHERNAKPIRPKGGVTSRGLSGFQTPTFTKTLNKSTFGPETGLQSWATF